jgi:fructose-1,6-bisphosphatase II / sedoheptulose-1,7-bisphosphatase
MKNNLDRNFALEAIRATEAAALACFDWIGRGDETSADQAAVNALRERLNKIDMDGVVVIGEGERDKAPMLYIGEKVGTGEGPRTEIALDPLEGTTICAKGTQNALCVVAIAQEGGFLHAPDVYMDKIAVGLHLPEHVIDLDDTPANNLRNIAQAKKCNIHDLTVVILDRPRHAELIARVREAGAKIQLIGDGDVAGVISTAMPHAAVDVYMGIGGAPEGVLAAAALLTTGGQIMGRLIFRNNEEKIRAKRMGIEDLNKKYLLTDMARGDVMFAATGVTSGSLLKGIRVVNNQAITYSIIMRSKSGTIREIKTYHRLHRG